MLLQLATSTHLCAKNDEIFVGIFGFQKYDTAHSELFLIYTYWVALKKTLQLAAYRVEYKERAQ